MLQANWQPSLKDTGHLPPHDVGAADGAEGPEEDRGSRSNKELGNVMGTETVGFDLARLQQRTSLQHTSTQTTAIASKLSRFNLHVGLMD